MSISVALSNPGTAVAVGSFVTAAVSAAVVAATSPATTSVLLVGGAYLAVGAAYYHWTEQNKVDIQKVAMTKYCSINGQSSLCGDLEFTGGKLAGVLYRGKCDVAYDNGSQVITSNGLRTFGGRNGDGTVYGPIEGAKVIPDAEADWKYSVALVGANGSYAWFTRSIPPTTRVRNLTLTRDDGGAVDPTQTKSPPKPWAEWDEAARRQAIEGLNNDDWLNQIRNMPQGGTIATGQTFSNDVISLDNGQVQKAGTKPLTPEQQAVRDVIKPELDRLNDIDKKVTDLALTLAAAGLIGGTIGNIDKNVANLGNIATQTKQSVDNVASKVDAATNQMNDNFNKVRKRLSGIASFLNFDRILNLLIWWQTLHNAFMLSADLGRSLVSAFSTALKALPGDSLLGLPTESEDGSPLDLATTINQSVENWIKGAIGAENYKLMKLELAQINRIYQSTSNIWSNSTSIFDSFRSNLALGIERISIVGNALRRNGVVRDDAYEPMSEKVTIKPSGLARIDRVTQGLEALSNATSAVESVASDVVSIQEEVIEIKKNRKEYEDEKTKLTKEIEKKETDSKKDSQVPEITEEDEQKHEPKKL